MSVKTPVRLTGPRAVIAAIPPLVGFVPTNSVVIIVTRGGFVALTMRWEPPRTEDQRRYLAETTRDAARQIGGDAYLVVTYADSLVSAGASTVVQEPALSELHLTDDMWVVGDEAGSWLCDGADCCPFTVPAPDGDLGLIDGAPLADRAALVQALSHCESDRERYVPVPHMVDRRMIAAVAKRLTSADPRDVTPTIGDYFLAICTKDTSWEWDKRDRLIATVTSRVPKANIQTLAQHTPDDHPDALAVLAMLAYMSGDGASASILLDRVGDAESSLAALVRVGLTEGVPPQGVVAGMEAILPDLRY